MDVGPAIDPEDLRAFEARFAKRKAAVPAIEHVEPNAKRNKLVADPSVHAAALASEAALRRGAIAAVRSLGPSHAVRAKYIEATIDLIFATGALVGPYRACSQRLLNARFIDLCKHLPDYRRSYRQMAEYIVDWLSKRFPPGDVSHDCWIDLLERQLVYVQAAEPGPLDPARRYVRPAIVQSPQIPQKAPDT